MEPYYEIKKSLIDCLAKSYFWWNLFQFTWQLSNHAGWLVIAGIKIRSRISGRGQPHVWNVNTINSRPLTHTREICKIFSNKTQLSMNDFCCKRTIFGIGTRALKSQVNNFKTFFNLKTKSASHNILCLRAISCSGQAFSRLSF